MADRFYELHGHIGGKDSTRDEHHSMVGSTYSFVFPQFYFPPFTYFSIVKINAQRYGPVWASIARDYLSIMASSVSSERAFSQGGITISKRCNRLKGDIVEAIQCVKCAIHHDLLFHEVGPSSVVEDEPDKFELEEEPGEKSEDNIEEEGWDDIFLHDDDLESDNEMDET